MPASPGTVSLTKRPSAQGGPALDVLPLVIQAVPPARPDRPTKTGVVIAAWILLAFACAGSLIPGLGFGMWLIISPLLLITLVLGVVAILKGRTVGGLLIIAMSLIVVPLFVTVAPFASTALALTAAPSVLPPSAPQDPMPQEAGPLAGVVSMPMASSGGMPEGTTTTREEPNLTAIAADLPVTTSDHLSDAVTAPKLAPINAMAEESGVESVRTGLISAKVRYAVLRTQPTLFSKGLGRLLPGSKVTLGAPVENSSWISVSTVDGRRGYLVRREIDFQ